MDGDGVGVDRVRVPNVDLKGCGFLFAGYDVIMIYLKQELI